MGAADSDDAALRKGYRCVTRVQDVDDAALVKVTQAEVGHTGAGGC